MKYTLPRIKLTPAPVHVVQYYGSPHAYGIEFTTRATTTKGIALAAARAASEDAAFYANRPDDPVVSSIDFVALLPRDWSDPEMCRLQCIIDEEASRPRAPKQHKSAEHPNAYINNSLQD